MIYIILSVVVLFILLGIWILSRLLRQKKSFGVLNEKIFYADSDKIFSEILYSKSTNLRGKPDYIVKKDGYYIPVEVKTGKTPNSPYLNHTTQLMAYCFLVEEVYGLRPPGGYLKYNEKVFQIAYTDEARNSIIQITEEISRLKSNVVKPKCDHCGN